MPQQQNQLVSIIIPTCNEGSLLHETVNSILTQTTYPDIEIIIVDDGSTDGSCEPFKNAGESIRVVTANNLGVARARNLGARHAWGDYLVFLDAHCNVSPNWIERFVAAFNAPDVALVGPSFTRLREPEPRGCGMTWMDYTLQQIWFEPHDIGRPYEVPLTPGGCQAFRTSTFNAVGKYDEGFERWGSEDIEICIRAWLLGYRILVDPQIVIAHYFRDSRNYEVVDKMVVYNFLRMIHLHLSYTRIQRVLKAISPNPHLQETLEALQHSDVFEIRQEMEAVRVRDDDWFFNVFMKELKSSTPA